jgi:UDP-N-acetylmuramoyl-tripeptide--D-alanyl-D-alanine ligase
MPTVRRHSPVRPRPDRRAAESTTSPVISTRSSSTSASLRPTQPALQTLAAHVVARLRDGLTVAALTGSQGKTGTKDLLAAVLSSAAPTIGTLNNGLGVPLTMLRADAATRFLVLEMGASHIGDIAELAGLVAPDIGVVLNVGQAHIGKFGSRQAIARTKGELVQGLAPGGIAVLNADDPRVVAMRSLTGGPVLTFGRAEHADMRALDLALDRLGRPSFTLRTADASAPVALPLVGAHQALNASAAAAAGLAAGVPLDVATAALATASLSKWRMELRELAGGATLLNDSYNANPDSTRAGLDALAAIEGGRRIAVLGEMRELGDDSEAEHRAVGEYAASRADVVAAVGEALLDLGGAPGVRAHRRAEPDRERAVCLETGRQRVEPRADLAGPVDDRALGQVGQREAFEPRHRAVRDEPGTDQLPAVVPAEGLAAPLGLDAAPCRGLQEADRPLCPHERQVLGGADRPDGQTHARDPGPSVVRGSAHWSTILTPAFSDRALMHPGCHQGELAARRLT